jgi:hypothetical protein
MSSWQPRSPFAFALVTLAALAAACSSAPSSGPSAVVPAPEKDPDIEAWRQAMARSPHPQGGCFQVTHPSTTWVEVPCLTASPVPYVHAQAPRPQVGNLSADVAPEVSNTTFTWVEGSFPQVTGVTGDSAYSLQINTNLIDNPPLCQGASDPTKCQGWQQFLFARETDGGSQMVYVQYWLYNLGTSCPSGWISSDGGCFTNSPAVAVPHQSLTNLANLTLTGAAGATDSVTLSVGGTTLYHVSQPSLQNLSAHWKVVEFNVVGDGNGSQVAFNPGSTLFVQTLTSTASGTRGLPGDYGLSLTGETNNLTLVAGSACAFGGDHPGFQFMETNVAGVTAPTCPSLSPSPNPVHVPQGGWASSNVEISGNLVGQSSNVSLQPGTCKVTVPPPVTATALPRSAALGVGPEIDYSVPASTPVGSSFVANIDCENEELTQQTITVVSPMLTASPGTIEVLEGSCGSGRYAGASLLWAIPNEGYCDTVTYKVTSTLPPGISAYTSNAYVAVCDASGHPQSFDLTVTSNGCGDGPASANIHVNVVSCIPKTSCASSCQAAMPDGCGGFINCSSSCTGIYTCTAPQGSATGLACCGPGQYIPAGGTSCVCQNGGTWSSSLGECIPPTPTCPAGLVYCGATGTCLTSSACAAQSGGGCTPQQVRNHSCT